MSNPIEAEQHALTEKVRDARSAYSAHLEGCAACASGEPCDERKRLRKKLDAADDEYADASEAWDRGLTFAEFRKARGGG